MADSAGLDKITYLVRTYFKMDGHHIQFNVISADALREAQRNPEKFYRQKSWLFRLLHKFR